MTKIGAPASSGGPATSTANDLAAASAKRPDTIAKQPDGIRNQPNSAGDSLTSTPPRNKTAAPTEGVKLAPRRDAQDLAAAPAPTAARARALIARTTSDIEEGGSTGLEELAAGVLAEPEPTRSQLVTLILAELPYVQTDDFARALRQASSLEALRELGLDARAALVTAVRQGVITQADREIYNHLATGVHDDVLAGELAALADPTQAPRLREGFKKRLGEGRTVHFGDSAIVAPRPATAQWGINFFYQHLIEKPVPLPYVAVPFSSPADIAAAMRRPLAVSAKTGKPVHLEGTTLYRPGLGNVPPSPASLFRLAQHTDRLVLMYTLDDGSAASQLRPLETYNGSPVPPELEGKLFAVGQATRVLQTTRAGAGVLIEQLERVRVGGARFGLSLDGATAIAHSQGNIEIALARLVLAAHGHPDVIGRHIALSPALRGSLVADGSPIFGVIGWASASFDDAAKNAITDLDPDTVATFLPEFLRNTVDLSVLGLTTAPKAAAYSKWLMHGTAAMAEGGLQGEGGDGMVDRRVADYVREPQKFVLTDKPFDHFAMIVDPDAVDAWLPLVEAPSAKSNELLRVVGAL